MWKTMAPLLLVLLFPILAQAADDRFKQGTWEIAIGFGSVAGVEPFVGYFLADNLEGILHFDYVHENLSNNGTTQKSDSVGVGGAAYYNLQTGTMVVPFFGPDVSYFNSHSSGYKNDSVQLTGDVGVRLLVGQRASVDIAGTGGYEWFSYSAGGFTSRFSGWLAGVKLAYSIFFYGP